MRVQAVAHIMNEDAVCEPGDIFDMRDGIAEVYLKNGLVKRYRPPKVEFAAVEGAAERAVSRRGRTRLQRQ